MDNKWYSNFLANSDQNLKVEEFEPVIYFANREHTPLQQIVRFGEIVYNGSKGDCVNIEDAPLREKKIETDVHEYRARLKFPDKVKITAVEKGDGTETHKWNGKAIPTGQYALTLGTYSHSPISGSELNGLKDARAIGENMVLNYPTTNENYTVIDVDKNANKVLVRKPNQATDPWLPGTEFSTTDPVATTGSNEMLIQYNAQYENGYASNGPGMEKTAIYKNFAQFFDTSWGQTLTADAMKFHGGDPRKSMQAYNAELMGKAIERSMLWGQGRYVKDPSDETNRQQMAQGIIPALLNGPNAGDFVQVLSTAMTENTLCSFLDKINKKDSSMSPCLVSYRFLETLNQLERSKVVPRDYSYSSCGLQIKEFISNLGKNKFIYEPFLDDQTTIVNGERVYVDCVKYNFDRWANICKLVPLTLRTDIGKYTGATTLKTWAFTIMTYEWNHPELGGLLCTKVNP